RTQSPGQSFLILSDTYYPGWKAFIDGRETTIYKTNGIVRGTFVSPGTHLVRFVYSPLSFKIGTLVSISTLLPLILLSIFLVRSQMVHKGNKKFNLDKKAKESLNPLG
ncbi:MAG: YfhO family protein, partial [Thermodesulfobacteriota bacterium]